MWDDIQAAIIPGFILSYMIGPVFFVLLETSALKGFRAAIAFDMGVLTADVLFIVTAYFSSFQLLENLSNQPGLYVFGGTILVVYGLNTILKKAPKNIEIPKQAVVNVSRGYLGLFIKGFLLNFINIGVLVFWLGVIIVVGPSLDNDSNRIVTFFSTMIISYFIMDIFKILLAKRLKRKLTKKRIRLIKKGIGFILILSGLVLMINGFLPKDFFNIENELERIENIR